MTETHYELLCKGLAEGGLPCTWRPMQEHCAIKGDQVGVNSLLPKQNGLHHRYWPDPDNYMCCLVVNLLYLHARCA